MTMQSSTQTKTTPPSAPAQTGLLQRKCAQCSEKENEKGKLLQRRAVNQSEVAEVPAIVHDVLRSPGQPLDNSTHSFMQSRFGQDFSHVRVHTDAQAAESAQAVNALAYTVGHNVVFGAGQYLPSTQSGKRLLAHELAHTVQQQGQASSLQSKLRVSDASDPAEFAADRAADAVMAGAIVPALTPVASTLSRQEAPNRPVDLRINPNDYFVDPPLPGSYRVTRVETIDDDTKLVYLSNGERYRVRRRRWITERAGSGGPFARVSPGIDEQKVWLDLEWCAGATEGQIRAGANIPEQVIQLVINTVTSGGDIDGALRGVSITPFTEAEVRIGRWRITPRAETTIRPGTGVTDIQGQVGVEVDTPSGTVGVQGRLGSQTVDGNPLGGIQGGITITFTPGSPPERSSRCDRRRRTLVENTRYECQQERDIPAQQIPRTRSVNRPEQQTRFLYFDYATARLDRQRSASALRELDASLDQGFRVSTVRGFTSPEGPRAPGRRFQGNDQLSRERAEATVAEVGRICRDRGISPCFAADSSTTGESELYTLETLEGQEVEGAQQADHAAAEFLAQEQEAPHRTPDLTRRLEQTRTPQERADLVYPLLRRSAITLTRIQTVNETYTEEIPGYVQHRDIRGGCPADILRRAFPGARSRE